MSRPRILMSSIPPSRYPRLRNALKSLGFEGGPEIVFETRPEGPYGIEKPWPMSTRRWRCRCAVW